MKFNKVYINNNYTLIAGTEHNPSISKNVDESFNNYYFKSKTLEEAEVNYQLETIKKLLLKQKLNTKEIDLLISADLQNQLFASNFAASNTNIPFLGIYSACASFVEGLIIASCFIDSKKMKNSIVTTSSHNLVSEKQFRFPIEYGALRHKTNTFTATGSVSAFVSNKESNIKIESATIGSVIDVGYKDLDNMGGVMASSAAEVIYKHFQENSRDENYYDIILTGDIGVYGINILKDYIKQKYNIKLKNVKDAGVILYNSKEDDYFAGGSGPICLALVLFSKIIPSKKYKRILIVGTGSLHSTMNSKLKLSIPSVAHAVSLEVN